MALVPVATEAPSWGYLPKPYEFDRLLEVLRDANQTRLTKKLASTQDGSARVMAQAEGQSALGVLRALRELEDGEGQGLGSRGSRGCSAAP